MKASTHSGPVHERLSSTGVADPKTAALKPSGCSSVWLCAETTSARVTLDGSDPSAASAPSIVVVAGANPVFFAFGPDLQVRHCSAVAGTSVLQILYGK